MKIKQNKTTLLCFKPFLCITATLGMIGCGNAWISSDSTHQKLIEDGHEAANAGNFSSAIKNFSLALQNDESNTDLRTRLAYAYNGAAGLSAPALFENLQSSKSTTLNAAGGGLSQIATLIGFDAAAKNAFIQKMEASDKKDIDTLRSFAPQLETLHKGWKVVCRLLPKKTIKKLIQENENTLRVSNGKLCFNGMENSKSPASANFAAVLQLLTEAVYLYQTVFDVNGDNKIDFVEEATQVNNEIKSIKDSIGTAVGSEVPTLMRELNTNLEKLTEIGEELTSDAVITGILNFSLVSSLVQNLAGIPDELKKQITQGAGKLVDAKKIIDGFTSQNSTTNNGAVASADTASQAISDFAARIDSLSGEDKLQAQEELAQACDQFDSLKGVYGLPASSQPPSECQ